jgi:toxin ParE1/3/4
MSEYILTKRAETDLYDVFLFGYQQFGVKQAEAYAAGLADTFQLLADNPHGAKGRSGRTRRSAA